MLTFSISQKLNTLWTLNVIIKWISSERGWVFFLIQCCGTRIWRFSCLFPGLWLARPQSRSLLWPKRPLLRPIWSLPQAIWPVRQTPSPSRSLRPPPSSTPRPLWQEALPRAVQVNVFFFLFDEYHNNININIHNK